MDWSVVIIQVAKLVGYAFPFSLIFGVTAKLVNMTLDMIFNKKIEMQEDKKNDEWWNFFNYMYCYVSSWFAIQCISLDLKKGLQK